MRLPPRPWIVPMVCVLFLGCDSGPKLYEVSGNVTYDGKP